jgi:transposase-like protein
MRELANEATLASVSNKYGISVATLSTWKRGANYAPSMESQSPELSTPVDAELNFLKLENQYLKAKVARLEAGTPA